jgi:hypothetical protein
MSSSFARGEHRSVAKTSALLVPPAVSPPLAASAFRPVFAQGTAHFEDFSWEKVANSQL